MPELNGQRRDLRQDRVARGVAEKNTPWAQALGLGQDHVVLAFGGDHHRAHAKCPESDGRQNDRQAGQRRVADDIDDERGCELDRRPDRVPARQREDGDAQRQQVDQDEAEQIVGNRRQPHQRRNAVAQGARRARPGEERAEQRADRKRKQGRHQQQADRPGQGVHDQWQDFDRVLGDRIAEVQLQRGLHVLDVLDIQRLIEAELDVVRADHLLDALLHRAALLHGAHQSLPYRITWREAWHQEIQRRRTPQDDAELDQSTSEVGQLHASNPG